MLFRPYEYQQECLNTISNTRRRGRKKGIVVMASGLGKTVTAALDAKRWIRRRGGRLLYLCHQNDILVQARNTFEAVLGKDYTYGYFHGREKDWRKVDCLFASFQTMNGWREDGFRPNEFSYIVVDESHHGPAPTYLPTLQYFQPNFLLGFTATPERTDLQDIGEIYGEEIFHLPLEDALARSLLTPVDYRLLDDDLRNLKVLDMPIGRISLKRLNKTLFIPKRDHEIARIILERMEEMPDPRVMIFCASIRHCERLSAHLPNSFTIHSQLPYPEQQKRLEAFRDGLVNIILTVDKFNEGIDIPDANIIVFIRSTASRMIFFQQLGRGLRKYPGKEHVLVLDFARNCERLQIVHSLLSAVGAKYVIRAKARGGELTPFNVSVGKLEFTEVVKRVLDVIEVIKGGYTKEMLIAQLVSIAKMRGRVPTRDDVDRASKKNICAHSSTFRKIFGTFPGALEAAGFPPNMKRRSRNELITELQELAEELGRIPTSKDIHQASSIGKCGALSVYMRIFGSVSDALRSAGFSAHIQRPDEYSKKELIEQLKELARKLKKTPSATDVRRAAKSGRYATAYIFVRVFGSFAAALQAAGLPLGPAARYEKTELLRQLKRIARKIGRVPKIDDLSAVHIRGGIASLTPFRKAFGSFAEALKAAGFKVKVKREYRTEELIQQLKNLAKKLGKTPTTMDVDAASKKRQCAGSSTFFKRFGSFPTAQRAAGLTVTFRSYTKGELIQQLRKLAGRLRRRPMFDDVKEAHKKGQCASASVFYTHFGSFTAALKAARIR